MSPGEKEAAALLGSRLADLACSVCGPSNAMAGLACAWADAFMKVVLTRATEYHAQMQTGADECPDYAALYEEARELGRVEGERISEMCTARKLQENAAGDA